MSTAVPPVGRVLRAIEGLSPELAAEAAYRLWRTPGRRPAVREDERSVLADADRSDLRVGDRRVRAYRWGDGPERILVVHGWQSRAAALTPIVRALQSDRRTVVGVDLPGHGESAGRDSDLVQSATALVELQRQGGGFDAVVAHSFGAAATAYAIDDGLQVGRFVSVSAAGEPEYFLHRAAAMLGMTERMTRGIVRRVEERVFRGIPDRWREFVSGPWRVPAELPLLLVHDERDRYVEYEQAEKLLAVNPHAEHLRTSGLGHNRILRDAYVIDAIAEFLAR